MLNADLVLSDSLGGGGFHGFRLSILMKSKYTQDEQNVCVFETPFEPDDKNKKGRDVCFKRVNEKKKWKLKRRKQN